MPLFEYKCEECSHKFEELVSGSKQKIVCPKCKSEKVSKQLSVFASKNASSGPACPGGGSCGKGFS